MAIHNYRDFSYAELKSRNPQTATNMASSFCVYPWYCNLLCCYKKALIGQDIWVVASLLFPSTSALLRIGQ